MAPGSRTKTTDTWLLPDDEALVGRRVGELLPGSGWLCSQPGPVGLHEVHMHSTVEAALVCGGVQAFLPLPVGDRAASDTTVDNLRDAAAVVQLLRSRRLTEPEGEIFRAGRLAVRWFDSDVGPRLHRLLEEQTRLVWRGLRAATLPATLEDSAGRRTGGTRIGAAARELLERTGMPLSRGGVLRLWLSAAAPQRRARER